MRILALDTSQLQAALCLIEGDRILSEVIGEVSVAHSEALLPLIDKLVDQDGLGVIDAFAVGVGPGSFTGLRIGCSTVKSLAQVLGKPIYPFSSLAALQLSATKTDASVVAMANAYQAQVFVRWGQNEDVMTVVDWCKEHLIEVGAGKIRFCGNGAKLYWSAIEAAAKVQAELIDVPFILPRGIAAAVHAVSGRPPIGYLDLHANYLRPSQAEITLARSKGA